MRRVIGLDFGSSQSLVSVMEIGSTQTPEILKVDEDNEVSRTLLALDRNDDSLVAAGNEVRDLMRERWGKDFYVVRNFKRYLGETMPKDEDENENVAGKPSNKFCKLFLAHMYKKLYDHYNKELSEKKFSTCIAHPATWDETKIKRLVEIVREVGFPDVHAIAEPLAAVYAVMHSQNFSDKAEHYLVVDFGGGTLDVCVVEMGILGRFAKIVSRAGNPRLGGREFDGIIKEQYVRNANLEREWDDLSDRVKTLIWEECEKQKKQISENMSRGSSKSYTCIFETPSESKLPVTRADILNWSKKKGIIDAYRKCVNDALNKSGLNIREISKVILTGGTSQWWFFKEIFTSASASAMGGYGMDKDKVLLTEAPHTDVCKGCAIHVGCVKKLQPKQGIWIRYRVGHYKKADEGWTGLQQLRAPAVPGKQATHGLACLTNFPKSKLFSPYRIEFKWLNGIDESNLTEVNEETGVVEVHARSNKGVFSKLSRPVRWIAKKIVESGGGKVEEEDDTYALYIQMKETEAKLHYKLFMMDAKAKEKDRKIIDSSEEPAKGLPAGEYAECDVEPGYISQCGPMGFRSRVLKKITEDNGQS